MLLILEGKNQNQSSFLKLGVVELRLLGTCVRMRAPFRGVLSPEPWLRATVPGRRGHWMTHVVQTPGSSLEGQRWSRAGASVTRTHRTG